MRLLRVLRRPVAKFVSFVIVTSQIRNSMRLENCLITHRAVANNRVRLHTTASSWPKNIAPQSFRQKHMWAWPQWAAHTGWPAGIALCMEVGDNTNGTTSPHSRTNQTFQYDRIFWDFWLHYTTYGRTTYGQRSHDRAWEPQTVHE